MKKILFSLILFFVSFGNGLFAQSAKKISPQEFAAATMNNPRVQLVDVRTPGEFMGGHIYNADNIDVSNRKFAIEIQELDKNTPTYIYCENGERSSKASDLFLEQGFSRVYILEGGMQAWRANKISTRQDGELANLTMEEFIKLVSRDAKVLVDFTATWCGPCRILKPRVEALSEEVQIIYIDVDKNKALADAFEIRAIPHLHLYKKGKLARKSEGLISSGQLKRFIR